MEKFDKFIRFWVIVVAWVMIIASCCSCSTQHIPVEFVHRDSIFIEKLMKDSTFVKDSVFIYQKGDTVFKDKLKFVYKYVLLRDTMMTIKTDSIPVPVPVEKKRTWWEQTKIDIAEITTQLVVLAICYLLIRWIFRKFIKKE